MQIAVLGINHKFAALEVREHFAKLCHYYIRNQQDFLYPSVILSTCNRTEIYYSASDLSKAGDELHQLLSTPLYNNFYNTTYFFTGPDCFTHLAHVITGMDSAIIGETEIQGQVKKAYLIATANTSLPHELHYLFQKCMRIGKQIRSQLLLGKGGLSLEQALLDLWQLTFGSASVHRILFIGASEINHKMIQFFKLNQVPNVSLCNRSFEKTEAFAQDNEIHPLPWHAARQWPDYDMVVFGTKYPDYLATPKDCIGSTTRKRLLIDLSVPRNVDPALGNVPNVSLYNIDDMHALVSKEKKIDSRLAKTIETTLNHAAMRQHQIFLDKTSLPLAVEV
ncbi:glutamyl-tRNA reductase [Simkania negevensis]|uniref:Glutamyl-tRNA reductase n=1 Tax=Simkania negevensis TaxID=83561 RepID=A0ABS3AS10_9BACT|nr:glutamyl-tRNA reductase [Simkania negevensis]